MSTPTLEEFLACCAAELEFLTRDFGLVRLSDPREYNSYSICYRKGEIGVEVYGENYGQTASCDLVRGEDRVYLGLLVPYAERASPENRPVRPGQLGQVEAIARRLRRHAADFLSGDLERFEAALTEWRRVTRPRPVSEVQIADRRRLTAVTEAGHASRRGNDAEVVRLLEPFEAELSLHQRRLLDRSRGRLRGGGTGSE